jgi:hypothetical protein
VEHARPSALSTLRCLFPIRYPRANRLLRLNMKDNASQPDSINLNDPQVAFPAFTYSVRAVGHSENASERVVLEIGPVKSRPRQLAGKRACGISTSHMAVRLDS